MEKFKALKRYFGYDSFRKGQEEIIDTVLSGSDILAVMPTGAGKSLCFQLPAILSEGTAIVISPLISLMKDQIASLEENGIRAATINSLTGKGEFAHIMECAEKGLYKLLYVAPERLETPSFISLSEKLNISMICIDEAHCVSQWGQDFRSSYLKIASFISSLDKRPVVGAYTATATKNVKDDIIRLLELRNPKTVTTGLNRENLYFEVQTVKDKLTALKRCLDLHFDKSAIVYCSTRKNTEAVYEHLLENGYSVTKYHAGLDNEERKRNQDLFVKDDIKIMVATNAFGMGIDKSNVSLVVHFNMPGDIESYYQEAGRAGRDGENADCVLLYSGRDIITQKFFINNSADNEELSEEELQKLRRRKLYKLQQMIEYCKGEKCLRNYILNYFGERADSENCQNCSVCCGEKNYIDITIPAQKILSAVARTNQILPIDLLIDFLAGGEKALEFDEEFKTIKTFGIMKDTPKEKISEIIAYLLSEGMASYGEGEKSIKLNESSKNILFHSQRVHMDISGRKAEMKISKNTKIHDTENFDKELFSLLKALRKEIAAKSAVPAFVVFADSSLKEMSLKKPKTMSEFLQISGVGNKKAEKYGGMFLKAIMLYEAKES